jgi:RNA polymerase sigma factor (sigma-70 family)
VGVQREAAGAVVPAAPSDGRSFESVFTEYRLPMVRLAHVIIGSNEVAEEVVQEAFVRLHRRWADVKNPPGFLRTVVTNLCRTEIRRSRLARRSSPIVISINDPELDETWTAVCRLPFRQRAVLALRYYLDLPEAEIAQILDCRLGTVKSAHHRGIAKLREELS